MALQDSQASCVLWTKELDYMQKSLGLRHEYSVRDHNGPGSKSG